jgi:hypothetical protein
MGLFQQATNQAAYLKAGILGFQGSGKTYTAVEIMLGLHKLCNSDKPIYFLDTETGSDWAIPRFAEHGVELRVAKTRAFGDLLSGIQLAEQNGFGLIVDSVTHYWAEMIDAYKRQRRIGPRMAFHHWAVLKPEWQKFANAYINSRLHIVVCGRAGWEWGHEDDDEGHSELQKLGTRMKAEGEFGHEPNLLIEMKKVKGHDIGSTFRHAAYVVKDRNMGPGTLDGAVFDTPVFDNFLPHIKCLNLGGAHLGVDTDRNSDQMFEPAGESFSSKKRRAVIAVEEINGELEARYPGTGKQERIAKAALKKHLFQTYSDHQIAELSPDAVEAGLGRLLDIFADDEWVVRVEEIIAQAKSTVEEK